MKPLFPFKFIKYFFTIGIIFYSFFISVPSALAATGGTIIYLDSNGANPRSSPPYAGGFTVHKFLSGTDNFVTTDQLTNVSYLVVAGGGGGGRRVGGGGGAGGVIYASGATIAAGTYPVVIGAGGTTTANGSANGGNTTFNGLTAIGGGKGGDNLTPVTGAAGGSGGGTHAWNGTGGAGTAGQGNKGGGPGGWPSYVGGGGGKDSAGTMTSAGGGAGGAGHYYAEFVNIGGSPAGYFGGGGGGSGYTGTRGLGGVGGGGDGAAYGGAANGNPGVANTGGGGGGSANNTTGVGGTGGSGIVLIRYATVIPKYWVGSNGSWNNANNWASSSGGAGGAGVPGAGDSVFFDGGGTGNCNIDADVNVGVIQINSGYTGTITQTGAYTITTTQAASSFVQNSATSTVTLINTNTITGGFTLTSGTLNINSAGAVGTGTLTLAGGTINNTSGGTITLSNNNAQAWNGDFAFTGTNNLNLGTGAVTLSANRIVTVNNSGVLTVGGIIGGASKSLTKAGTGTLSLGGANTFSGGIIINAGTVLTGNATALGAGNVTLNDGTINLNGQALTLTGAYAQNGGTLTGAAGAISISSTFNQSAGTFNAGAATTIGVGGSFTQSGGTFTAGTGTTTMGTTFVQSGGTFTAGTATTSVGTTFSQSGGTFSLNGGSLTVGTSIALSGTSVFSLQGGEAVSKTPTISNTNTVIYTGTAGSYALKTWTYINLTIAGGANSVFALPANETLATTTITSGILSLAGYNFTTTNFSNDGTLRLKGSEATVITNFDSDSGTVEYVGNGDSAATVFNLKYFPYYNLKIASTDNTDSFSLPVTATVMGNLTITNGLVTDNVSDQTTGTITYTDSSGLNPVSNPPYADGYTVHTFTGSGTFTILGDLTIDYLMVAGGGGGGSGGGGGGAGGLKTATSQGLPAGSYQIVRGTGGPTDTSGNNTTFNGLIALGGGAGGSDTGLLGFVGGSGGGGRGRFGTGGSGTAGQGYAGGNGGDYSGGGGGGAGAVGQINQGWVAGYGGAGVQSSISGAATWYAGGGGGGGANGATGGAGGSNIGGLGIQGAERLGTAGAANTGSGGGGGGYWNYARAGGSGANGIVIIRYPTAEKNWSFVTATTTYTLNLHGNLTQTGGSLSASSTDLVLAGADQTLAFAATATLGALTKTLTEASPASTTLSFSGLSADSLIITGTTTLKGVVGKPLLLRSAAAETSWQFDPQGVRDFQYLDVQDSTNLNTVAVDASADGWFTDSGRNVNWTFGGASADIVVGRAGNQTATTTMTANDIPLGGAFTFLSTGGNPTVSSIRLKQAGSLPATAISDLKLFYDDVVDGECPSAKPVGAASFGNNGTFDENGFATTTGALLLSDGEKKCVYVTYDLAGELENNLGRNIDLEIADPSADVVVDLGSVSTTESVNISGRTIIMTPDIISMLSVKMKDPAKNPTVYYFQDNAVWKMVAGGTPYRLTNPNLKVHSLTFQDLSGARGDNVKITITVSNVDLGTDPNFMTVTKTLTTSASVKAVGWE